MVRKKHYHHKYKLITNQILLTRDAFVIILLTTQKDQENKLRDAI